MNKSESAFREIGKEIKGVKEGKMFGCLCLKTPKGKSAAMLWKDDLVVKLNPTDLDKTLKLKGVIYFEPMDNRPMKEWVQVPLTHVDKWENLIRKSLDYVNSLK